MKENPVNKDIKASELGVGQIAFYRKMIVMKSFSDLVLIKDPDGLHFGDVWIGSQLDGMNVSL